MKTLEQIQKDLDRWKDRYRCSLGDDNGLCDGADAKRCPSAINTGDGTFACEVAL